MSDALAKVRAELGRDAVILHTRTVRRGGLFGLGARALVEITATADQRVALLRSPAMQGSNERLNKPRVNHDRGGGSPLAAPTSDGKAVSNAPPSLLPAGGGVPDAPRHLPLPVKWAVPPTAAEPAVANAAPEAPHPFTLIDNLETPQASDRISPPVRPGEMKGPLPKNIEVGSVRVAPVAVPVASVGADPVLRTEMLEIRAMVRDLWRHTETAKRPAVPAELVDYYTQLISQDVAQEIVAQLLENTAAQVQERNTTHWDEHGRMISGQAISPEWVRQELERRLMEMVPSAAPLALTATGRPTVVAMVGPTGVGKTTTVAKLAANMKLREGRKVGLITVDTYRIAAVEQLKTYAEILQVPLIAVTTPDEMRQAVARLADVELILIDTAGRSQKDELRLSELNRFLSAVQPDQVHLVLSSTSREEAIREAVRNFSVLGARHLIFTKLDEAVGFGVILNVLHSVDLRLSYLTNGQSVPADIEVGSAQRVAQLILGTAAQPASMLASESVETRPTPAPVVEGVLT